MTRRAAVIGCGGRGRPHVRAYAGIDGVAVVACCDVHADRRDALASEFHLAAYADAGEMIRKERPDIVHLATGPDTRVELMTLVSELNVPLCTVEKPIAAGVKDWRALCRLEAASRTKFAVCHQFRWQPHLVKCQEALRSGRLGAVQFLDFSAGMTLPGQGTHTLNYARSLAGDAHVVRVAGNAYGWDESDPVHPGPLATEACLTFANGTRGLWTSGSLAPRCGDPSTTWQHVRACAFADRGRVRYEEFGVWQIVSPEGTEAGDYGGGEGWGSNNDAAQTGFYRAMFAWLDDDTQAPGTNLRASLHEWKTVLALYESALRRVPVEMDAFEPEDGLVQELASVLGGTP